MSTSRSLLARLATATLAASVFAAIPMTHAFASEPIVLTTPDGKHIALADQRAPYTAIHFLPAGDYADHIKSFAGASSRLIGVAQWFIAPESPAPVTGANFATDADGKLTAAFKISPGSHTLVVLDRAGNQILRVDNPTNIDQFIAKLQAATRPTAVDQYNLPRNSTLALAGYDPVAYFTDNKAAKGDAKITATFRGVEYRFASEEHRSLFAADPERYLPTYGGWCASAMGDRGAKVEIDPANFKVKDGRLFLFYKSLLADAKKDWDKREKEWEPAADSYWKKLSGEDAIKPAK